MGNSQNVGKIGKGKIIRNDIVDYILFGEYGQYTYFFFIGIYTGIVLNNQNLSSQTILK